MSAAGSTISEGQLGLTQSELLILRQQTEVALQSRSQGSAMAERGRGTSRHSQPSSRAASAASSHGSMQGRITLGSTDLSRITQSMDTVVRQMQTRYQQVRSPPGLLMLESTLTWVTDRAADRTRSRR